MNCGRETVWQTYEEVAAHLLNMFSKEFGLSTVEGKQPITGLRSGTSWRVDAKGILVGGEGFVIVECRRYTKSKQDQEKLGGLAYRIIDAGAASGILVSPLGLQTGAKKIADAEKIISIELDEDSTPTEFVMQFLNKIFVGIHERVIATDKLDVEHFRSCSNCGCRFAVLKDEHTCLSCTPRA